MKKFDDSLTKQHTKLTFYVMNNTKGITLIVLIITITVLLILAGVTIANITGGDGVMQQAHEKKDKTKIASEEAILGNAVIEATDKFGNITEENLGSALSKNNVEITPSGGLYRIVFKDSNNLYKMNKDGEFFYWEDMAPTDIYAKKDGTTLYLRSTQATGYTKATRWNDSSITKIVIEEPIAPRTCYEMFFNCTALEEIENIENLHTENSTHMRSMFSDCNNLNSLNLKYFDTSNVTSMYLMFNSCKALTSIDISNFDTCNVKDMYGMFANCENVTTINLSNINTDKTSGSMAYMFNHCHKLTSLDLTKFNTQNITYMNYMFNYCRVLKKIYVSDNWTVNNVSNSSSLFNGCGKLVGGNGTTYDPEHVDETYARIDGGPNSSTPGYFTLKEN